MKSKKECIFCKIVRWELPCHKIWEDEVFLVILDIDPISDGHSLILTKQHFPDIFSLDDNVSSKLIPLAKRIGYTLKNVFNYDGITLMQTNGHFQDVPHFHLHVFGRKKQNDIKIIYPDNTKGDEKHLKQIYETLKDKIIFNL